MDSSEWRQKSIMKMFHADKASQAINASTTESVDVDNADNSYDPYLAFRDGKFYNPFGQETYCSINIVLEASLANIQLQLIVTRNGTFHATPIDSKLITNSTFCSGTTTFYLEAGDYMEIKILNGHTGSVTYSWDLGITFWLLN